jgi:flagellar biosynthetic protein FlhB
MQPVDVQEFIITFGLCIAPFLATALIVGVVISYLQVGFMFNVSSIKPKMSKINPIEGFKRIFSKKTLFTFIKTIIKLVIIGVIGYQVLMEYIPEMTQLVGVSLQEGLAIMFEKLMSLLNKIGIGLLVNAVADYIFEWFDHETKLKMTKQEIKDEYKKMEGDPLVKSNIRNKQLAMARMRMMQEVPNADVIITNPTHYAIAIKYKSGKDKAPIVIAKGRDKVAEKIKEIAKNHDIVIVENKPLAQTLYRKVELGDQIPYDMFQAVAEILAYVYKVKNRLL